MVTSFLMEITPELRSLLAPQTGQAARDMEITPEAQKPVGARTRIGVPDPAFRGAGCVDRMAIMCERLREDGLYDMAWALGVTRNPTGFLEPRVTVGRNRFTMDLRRALC